MAKKRSKLKPAAAGPVIETVGDQEVIRTFSFMPPYMVARMSKADQPKNTTKADQPIKTDQPAPDKIDPTAELP